MRKFVSPKLCPAHIAYHYIIFKADNFKQYFRILSYSIVATARLKFVPMKTSDFHVKKLINLQIYFYGDANLFILV